jgi:ABC-type thiamin/hydroxymethylpyrimidine transport system permease subunit
MHTRKLALVVMLSTLGGISSVIVGYAGGTMTFIPIGPIFSGQLLAGLHIFWLALVAIVTRTKGAVSMAGAIKGLVEMLLPNHLGPLVFLISFLEGLVLDMVLLPSRSYNSGLVCFAGGLSSAANVLIIQLFLLTNLPFGIYASMYTISFCSGLLFGGYMSIKTVKSVRKILQT